MLSRRLTKTAMAAAIGAVALLVTPAAAHVGTRVVAEGLFNPRGIDITQSGRLLVAENGSGEITKIRLRRHGDASTTTLATLPAVPAQTLGPVDVAGTGDGGAYVAMSGPPETSSEPYGELVRVRKNGSTQVVADIVDYQQGDPDPYDLEDNPTESNPNGLALLKGGRVLVADAAGNDLLLVDRHGGITTVARFKPELVPWPPDLPFGPPAGTPVPSESVPTAVAVGRDGAWYVSELKGFPFAKGTSRIWRIQPGSTGATCDPASPNSGPCRTVATGFSSVIDLAFGDHGALYVLEIAKEGLVDVEVRGNPPISALWRVHRGRKTELAPGQLLFAGGVAVDDDVAYVTTGSVFGPGAGTVVRIGDEDRDDDDDDGDDDD